MYLQTSLFTFQSPPAAAAPVSASECYETIRHQLFQRSLWKYCTRLQFSFPHTQTAPPPHRFSEQNDRPNTYLPIFDWTAVASLRSAADKSLHDLVNKLPEACQSNLSKVILAAPSRATTTTSGSTRPKASQSNRSTRLSVRDDRWLHLHSNRQNSHFYLGDVSC